MTTTSTDRIIKEGELEKIVQSIRHYAPGAYGAMREGEEGKYVHINELLEAVAEKAKFDINEQIIMEQLKEKQKAAQKRKAANQAKPTKAKAPKKVKPKPSQHLSINTTPRSKPAIKRTNANPEDIARMEARRRIEDIMIARELGLDSF